MRAPDTRRWICNHFSMGDFATSLVNDWQSAGFAVAVSLSLALGAVIWRLQVRMRRVMDALNHMSQGLCMFDKFKRIVICNRQYIEMYKLSPGVVKPGCTLRELMEHRKNTGLFAGEIDEFCKGITDGVASGKPTRWLMAAGWRRMRTSPSNCGCNSSATKRRRSSAGAARSRRSSPPSAPAWRHCSRRSATMPRP
jgi:PAS domain-containing protein